MISGGGRGNQGKKLHRGSNRGGPARSAEAFSALIYFYTKNTCFHTVSEQNLEDYNYLTLYVSSTDK